MKLTATIAALVLAALASGAATQANAFYVYLGQSAQDFTLYGQGAYAPGLGSFTIGQGSGAYDSITNTSTFTLSGSIASGSSGYGSGGYSFVTTYLGNDTPTGGPNAIQAITDPSDLDYFYYSRLAPSTNITLYLTGTPDGNLTLPLVTYGVYDGPSFFFDYTDATCTGSPASCTQNDVGLAPGSSISGPATLYIFVPEPGAWAEMLVGLGALGLVARTRRKVVAAAA